MDSQSIPENAQEKILNAVVGLIESGEQDSPTVRQIASCAGVNVGAVNYYFGSKDALLDAAGKQVLQRIQDCFPILDDLSLPPLERLQRFMLLFIPKMIAFRASLFHRLLVNRISSGDGFHFKEKHELAVYMRDNILERVNATVMEITGDTDKDRARILSLQLLCAVVMPNLQPVRAHLLEEVELPPIEEQVSALLARMFR